MKAINHQGEYIVVILVISYTPNVTNVSNSAGFLQITVSFKNLDKQS